jgi:hypothetical protein
MRSDGAARRREPGKMRHVALPNNHVHYHSNVPTLTIDTPEAAGANHQT